MAAVANPANRPNRYMGTGRITSQIVILSLFYINPDVFCIWGLDPKNADWQSKTGTRRDKTQRLEAGGDRWIYAGLREGLGAWPSPPRRVCARMLTPACPCHFANSRARGPNHPSPFVTL
jgi:hypothetical protein